MEGRNVRWNIYCTSLYTVPVKGLDTPFNSFESSQTFDWLCIYLANTVFQKVYVHTGGVIHLAIGSMSCSRTFQRGHMTVDGHSGFAGIKPVKLWLAGGTVCLTAVIQNTHRHNLSNLKIIINCWKVLSKWTKGWGEKNISTFGHKTASRRTNVLFWVEDWAPFTCLEIYNKPI